MFAKCLKHEMKATSRVLLPILISMVVVSVAAALSLIGVFSMQNAYMEEALETGELSQSSTVMYNILNVLTALLMFAFAISLIVAAIAVFVIMVRRFYTSFFTDEGYLTFTLPVTVDCHIITKSVAMIIWNVASYIAMGVSVAVLFFGVSIIIPDAFEIDAYTKLHLETFVTKLVETFGGTIIFALIQMAISSVASQLLLFFSISVGCMLTKKHRFIVCAACVLIIDAVVTEIIAIASQLATIPFANISYTEANADLLGMLVVLISTLFYAAQGVGCYFGTRWILKNKINLD